MHTASKIKHILIQGMLMILVAILLSKLSHRVGRKSIWVILLAVWLTWAMAASEVANAWWGTNQILPITAREAGAVGGVAWQERAVTLTHTSAGLALIVAWALVIVGFVRVREAERAGWWRGCRAQPSKFGRMSVAGYRKNTFIRKGGFRCAGLIHQSLVFCWRCAH